MRLPIPPIALIWWLHRESNSGYRRERAVSWPLDHGAIYLRNRQRPYNEQAQSCEFHGFLPCGNAVLIVGNRTFPERSDVDGYLNSLLFKRNRQRPTFPGSFPPSIIGAKELNFCVRDGNRCDLLAIVTGFFFNLFKKLNKIFLTYYSSYSHTLKHMTKLSVECLAFAWDILPSYAKAYDNAYDKENLLVKCSTY